MNKKNGESECGYERRVKACFMAEPIAEVDAGNDLSLRGLFERYTEYVWLFVRPGGNWGDYLIYAGAESLAEEVGLCWRSCTSEELGRQDIGSDMCIYLHGSGGYNSWGSGRPFSDLGWAARTPAKLVVQGPHTAEDDEVVTGGRMWNAIENHKCGNLVFFAREQVTLDMLGRTGIGQLGCELRIDHDTALHLTREDVLQLAGMGRMPEGRYALFACRRDNETVPAGSTNALDPGNGVMLDPAYFCKTFEHWIKVHAFAESIISNRLHSAILGLIVGRPVTLTQGSYHKNKSVWEYSLRDIGAEWSEKTMPVSVSQSRWLPRRLANSYKVGRVRKYLRGVPLS